MPAAKPVPIEKPQSTTVDTVQSVETSSELNTVQVAEPTSNPFETAASAEIITTTETTVTSTETHENKNDSITTSESETVSNTETDTTKLSEPENSEMTGKHQLSRLFFFFDSLINVMRFYLL